MTDILIIVLLFAIWLEVSVFGKWLYLKLRHYKILLKRFVKKTIKR